MENLVSVFKKVILLDIIIFVTLIILYGFYYDADSEIVYSSSITPIEVISLGLILIQVVLYYLLLKFKPLGKKLIIPFFSVAFVVAALAPVDYTVYPNFIYSIEWLSGMTTGALLALIYFTDLKNKFDG